MKSNPVLRIQPNEKFTIHPQSSRRGGFTLVELLVVITIIAALASLMYPLVGHFRKKAQASESLNRIRQCGLIVLSKATESNNVLQIHISGTASNMQDLRLHGMVQESVGKDMVGKLVYTPAYEKKADGTWPVWATNLDSNPSIGIVWERLWVTRNGEQRYLEGLRLATCGSPERYPLFADSSNASGEPRARFGNNDDYKFAMRYGRKGTIFFLDGAARLVGQDEMAKYGITRAYVFGNDPTSRPTPVAATVIP
jgi:prepilin-type N-terminal cleavage/methylation domain-containing protein